MRDRTVAMVPIRSGSKGIPSNNIKPIAGQPLCCWVLTTALDSELIDGVYVSTESLEVANAVRAVSDRIFVVDRPNELSSDTATAEQVMMHFAGVCEFDGLVTIQATSPVLSSKDLDAALQRLSDERLDGMLSGVAQSGFCWSLDGKPLNYDPANLPRRQDWGGHGAVRDMCGSYVKLRSSL